VTVELAKLILEYIRVFIWPITVFAAILLFYKQIRNLIGRVKRADFPGGIAIETFPEEIQQAKKLSIEVKDDKETGEKKNRGPAIPLTEANAEMINLGLIPSPSGLDLSYYRIRAEEDPNLALAGLRIEAETMLKNLAKGFKVQINERDSATVIASKLKEKGAITLNQFELISSMIKICNAAVHGRKVTLAQANDVLDIAVVLVDQYIAWLSWGFKK